MNYGIRSSMLSYCTILANLRHAIPGASDFFSASLHLVPGKSLKIQDPVNCRPQRRKGRKEAETQ